MKILFQASFLSPCWKGYLANKLLNYLSKSLKTESKLASSNLSVMHLGENKLLHSLGKETEINLDKKIISFQSSLSAYLETFDLQILMCDWKEAWNLLLPNSINIVIGLNKDTEAFQMLGNCYKKIPIENTIIPNLKESFDKESQFNHIPIQDQNFKFVYPESFNYLNESMIKNWVKGLKKSNNERLVIYYPSLYCEPEVLGSALVDLEIGDLDVDIIAGAETISSLSAIENHPMCKQAYIGRDTNSQFSENKINLDIVDAIKGIC